MDIKHVLVPVDFSPPSQLAVNHGVALARALRGTLTPSVGALYERPLFVALKRKTGGHRLDVS